ncbi:hypothetical protein GCN74_14130 [Janthinobacterium sp. FT14W]|nr:hypothetical protein GCN74_14130 [Janthinobacterium sp. FT14W]
MGTGTGSGAGVGVGTGVGVGVGVGAGVGATATGASLTAALPPPQAASTAPTARLANRSVGVAQRGRCGVVDICMGVSNLDLLICFYLIYHNGISDISIISMW